MATTYTSKKGQTVTTELLFGKALEILSGMPGNTFAAKLYDQEATYQHQCRVQGTNYPRGYWPLKGDQRFWVYKIAQDCLDRQAKRQALSQAPAMPAAEQRTVNAAGKAAPADSTAPASTPKAKRGRKAKADKPAPVAATFVGQAPALLAALGRVQIDANRPDALIGYTLLGTAINSLSADESLRREAFLTLARWLGDAGRDIETLV